MMSGVGASLGSWTGVPRRRVWYPTHSWPSLGGLPVADVNAGKCASGVKVSQNGPKRLSEAKFSAGKIISGPGWGPEKFSGASPAPGGEVSDAWSRLVAGGDPSFARPGPTPLPNKQLGKCDTVLGRRGKSRREGNDEITSGEVSEIRHLPVHWVCPGHIDPCGHPG